MTSPDYASILSDDRRATVHRVNRALAAIGLDFDDIEFVRGRGYFYLAGAVGCGLYDSSFYTSPRVGDLTVGEWLQVITVLLHDQSADLPAHVLKVVEAVRAA